MKEEIHSVEKSRSSVVKGVLLLGRMLLLSSASSQRVEQSMKLLYSRFFPKDEVNALVTPDSVIMTVHSKEEGGLTHALAIGGLPGVNYRRLIALTRLLFRSSPGVVDASNLTPCINAVCDETGGYSIWFLLIAGGMASVGFAFLNGVVTAALVYMFLAGLIIQAVKMFLLKRRYNVYGSTLAAVFLGTGCGAAAISLAGLPLQPEALIAPALFQVPGVHAINAGVDVIRNKKGMAMARLLHVITILIMLSCGTTLSTWLIPGTIQRLPLPVHEPTLYLAMAQGVWAGIAALMLGVIMSAPLRMLPMYGILGFAVRFLRTEMLGNGVGIIPATFLAVCIVMVVIYLIALRMKLPPVIFSVLPVLPEIPGIFAIRGLHDYYKFCVGADHSAELLLQANQNIGLAVLIVFALVSGILLPLLVVDKDGPRFFTQ